jgi:hypothetical protein
MADDTTQDTQRAEASKARREMVSTVVVPLAAILSSAWLAYGSNTTAAEMTRQSNQTQIHLKEYEMSFTPKKNGYVGMMQAMNQAYRASLLGDKKRVDAELVKMDAALIELEPFVDDKTRKYLREHSADFWGFCQMSLKNRNDKSDEWLQSFDDRQWRFESELRDYLYNKLFREQKSLRVPR